MLILTTLLIFMALFLILNFILNSVFADKKKIKMRMNSYISAITADLSGNSKHFGEVQGETGPKFNRFREAFGYLGKGLEQRGYTKRIELELQKADLPLRGYEFVFLVVMTTVGMAFLCFWLNRNPLSMAVAGIIGMSSPIFMLKIKQQQKIHKFNNQIGDALVLISNSLKAGYGFMQALDMVAKEMPDPIQKEFSRVLQDINLGITTEDALLRLTARVISADLDLVITAMLIQRQIGGNLAEILDNISNTIRERIRIYGEVKTLTAQGRLSGLIIGSLPLALGLLLLILNPKYVTLLFEDPRGILMLVYAVVAEFIAILIIRKIISIKV